MQTRNYPTSQKSLLLLTSLCFMAGCSGAELEQDFAETADHVYSSSANAGGQQTGVYNPPVPTTAAPTKVIPHSGDINGDGKLTIADYYCYKQAAASAVGTSPSCQKVSKEIADINCDGQISSTDKLLVKYLIMGKVAILSELSHIYKQKGDNFFHNTCYEKYAFMPNTPATWLSYLNGPLNYLLGSDANVMQDYDLVAATIASKDLRTILTDREQSQLANLENDFRSSSSGYRRNAATTGRNLTMNYRYLAAKASSLLNSVTFRILADPEVNDVPRTRALIRGAIARLLLVSYKPTQLLHYFLVSSSCDTDDEECKQETIKYPVNSSLLREQILKTGFGLDELGQYIVAQDSPIFAALHLGWVSAVENEYLKALNINFSDEFGLDDINQAMEALASALPSLSSGNGSPTTVGSAPAACSKASALMIETPVTGLLGGCSAGAPDAPIGGGVGPDPDPTAMPAPVDPAMTSQVPVWMNANSPCYGINPGHLFGTNSNPAKTALNVLGWWMTGSTSAASVVAGSGEIITTADIAKGIATGIVGHAVAAISGPLGGFTGTGASMVAGEVWDHVIGDGPGGFKMYDMAGREYTGTSLEAVHDQMTVAKIAQEKRYNTAAEAAAAADVSKNSGNDSSPNPLEDSATTELYQQCAQSIAGSMNACMFPVADEQNENPTGSVAQCDSVCVSAECVEGAFLLCSCTDAPAIPAASSQFGNEDSADQSEYSSTCHAACGLVGGPLMPEAPDGVICSGCPDTSAGSSPPNLNDICSGGAIPPGLIELCGAIDPAS